MKKDLQDWVSSHDFWGKYIAILYLWDNPASATYTRMKQRFAHDVGLSLSIIGQNNEITNYEELISVVEQLAQDDDCIWLMPQLPLPKEYRSYTMDILNRIPVSKDIDGLSWKFLGEYITKEIDFLGATPQAVFTLLDHYAYGNLEWKNITIIWQSNLIGKPLALGVLDRKGSLFSFNSSSDAQAIKRACLQSDIIISATGVIHGLDEEYFRDDKTQIVVDVGRGKKNGKPVGDIKLDYIKDRVAAYTPIPWGVWPLTIANLLMNIKRLYNKYW